MCLGSGTVKRQVMAIFLKQRLFMYSQVLNAWQIQDSNVRKFKRHLDENLPR